MKKRLYISLIFIFFLGPSFQTIAQFTPEEVAERPKWEEYLKTAEIVDYWEMTSREAVTSPWVLTLEKDGIRRQALWKNPEGLLRGHLENWKWEIAAYRLDKYLGLNMVPPTVEKRFKGKRGSCQLWIDTWMDGRRKRRENIQIPSSKVSSWNKAMYLHYAFDNLIANEDRHSGNIKITKDWRIILIDHSRAFRTSEKFTKDLIYSERSKKRKKIMKKLSRAFVEKLKSLNFDLIKKIAGEYLIDRETEAVLIRKDLILKEINKRIIKFGEDEVLY